MGLKQWGANDLQASPEEMVILKKWEITEVPNFIGRKGVINTIGPSPEKREPPPDLTYKLNFDGASKGNPGLTGYGGANRNSDGKPVGIYWEYIGLNSNNLAELRGLFKVFTMAIWHGWLPLILEGDSQVILQMATKLMQGKLVSKPADNWKMTHSLELLRILLQRHFEVQIHHVRRKDNKLVDLVANYRAKQK